MISVSVVTDSVGQHSPRLSTFRLRELLDYDPITGLFNWRQTKQRSRSQFSGKIAGRTNTKGHIQITVDGKSYMAHHLAWFWMTGEWTTKQIDHKDRDKKNNKWVNLREATNGQNRANSKSSSISGFKGVYKNRRGNKWSAGIRVNNKLIPLGSYNTPEEAAEVYKIAADKYHGEFARTKS